MFKLLCACVIKLQVGESQDVLKVPRTNPIIVQQPGDAVGTHSYRVVCDGQELLCGENVIEAFDFFFKFIWVFALKYPSCLKKFFQLLQFKVYKIYYGAEKIPAGVNEVARLLDI